MKNRSFSPEFKEEAASLVLDQGYSIAQARITMDVSESALRKWVNQLQKERQGKTPTTGKAITADQRKIQELEAKVKRLERDKEILKKASALLMTDTLRQNEYWGSERSIKKANYLEYLAYQEVHITINKKI